MQKVSFPSSLNVRLCNALSAAAESGHLRSCLNTVMLDQASSASLNHQKANATELLKLQGELARLEGVEKQLAERDAELAECRAALKGALAEVQALTASLSEEKDRSESHGKTLEEALEPAAKRRRSCTDSPLDCLRGHIVAFGGKEFDVDIANGERVVDLKHKIVKQQDYQLMPQEMKLVLGTEVLDDMVVLSTTCLKYGKHLTLVKHVGIMQLLVDSISDNTQWHGRHKFALRSEPLSQEVEKIEVKVGDFQDQGWGGCQARLFIYLYNIEDNKEIARMKIFGPLRTREYDEHKHGRSPSCTIGETEPVVALARPGMLYKLKYQCGGGGGHSITVKNWSCKVFPKSRGTDEVTVQVKGTVRLVNTGRLGPDRATGKWELQEPPL